jgi:transposase-like protein
MDDDICPFFDRDNGTCIVVSDGEVTSTMVLFICTSWYSICPNYNEEQKEQRYRYVYCLSCRYDVEDSYGYSAAKEWDYCPQCGARLVRRPSPHYHTQKRTQTLKSFLSDKNGDSQ